MPATARQIPITEEQLASASSGPKDSAAYSAIVVPGDYVATLKDVQDYDFRSRGKSFGWLFLFDIMGCEFKEYVSFSEEARWKLIQVWDSLGGDPEIGVNNMDPNILIGREAGAHVDWQTDPTLLGENDVNYREIKYLFPITLVEPVAEEVEKF